MIKTGMHQVQIQNEGEECIELLLAFFRMRISKFYHSTQKIHSQSKDKICKGLMRMKKIE